MTVLIPEGQIEEREKIESLVRERWNDPVLWRQGAEAVPEGARRLVIVLGPETGGLRIGGLRNALELLRRSEVWFAAPKGGLIRLRPVPYFIRRRWVLALLLALVEEVAVFVTDLTSSRRDVTRGSLRER